MTAIYPFQVRAARATPGLTRAQRAKAAGVGRATIQRAETAPDDQPVPLRPAQAEAVRRACEARGVAFSRDGLAFRPPQPTA